jgi:hypothetical protein
LLLSAELAEPVGAQFLGDIAVFVAAEEGLTVAGSLSLRSRRSCQ